MQPHLNSKIWNITDIRLVIYKQYMWCYIAINLIHEWELYEEYCNNISVLGQLYFNDKTGENIVTIYLIYTLNNFHLKHLHEEQLLQLL